MSTKYNTFRLRRAVLHPNLVLSSNNGDRAEKASTSSGAIDIKELIQRFGEGENVVSDSKVYAESVLANLGQEENVECPICFDVMETPTILPECMHQWFVVFASIADRLAHSGLQLQGLHHRIH